MRHQSTPRPHFPVDPIEPLTALLDTIEPMFVTQWRTMLGRMRLTRQHKTLTHTRLPVSSGMRGCCSMLARVVCKQEDWPNMPM